MAKFTFAENFPSFRKPFNRQADLSIEAPDSDVTMATTCVSPAMSSNSKPIQLVHPAFLVPPPAYHSPQNHQDMDADKSQLQLRTNCLQSEDLPSQLSTKMAGHFIDRSRNALSNMRKQREFVPDYQKDDNYWVKRQKNNEAAKRSREKRRINDMALETKVVELMKENSLLKEELNALKKCFGLPTTVTFRLPSLPDGVVKIKTEVRDGADGGEYEHPSYTVENPQRTINVDKTYESACDYRRELKRLQNGSVSLLPSTAPLGTFQEKGVNELPSMPSREVQRKEPLSTIADAALKTPLERTNTSDKIPYKNDKSSSPPRKRSAAQVQTDVSGAVDLRLKVPENDTSQQSGDSPGTDDLKHQQHQHKLPLKIRSKKDGHSGRLSDQGNRDSQEICFSGVPQNYHANPDNHKSGVLNKGWCVETNDKAAGNYASSYVVHQNNSEVTDRNGFVGAVRHQTSDTFCRTPYEREDTRSHRSQNCDLENENVHLREKLQSLSKDVALLKEIVAAGVIAPR